MGEIVSAVATSHILMSPAGVESAASRVVEGMIRIGRHLRTSRPDVIVIISNDHMFNTGLGSASFVVGAARSYVPFGEMDIPREEYKGDPGFGQGLAERGRTQGMQIDPVENLKPDHGTAIPLLFVNPDRDALVVPILVQHGARTHVTVQECWRLGELLREFITQARPLKERVAIVGAGGLSHWVGYQDAHINEEFDRNFLASYSKGDLAGWRSQRTEDIEKIAGNGGVEVLNWLAVAAAAQCAPADIAFYEQMPSWMTGMGGAILRLRENTNN